MRKSFLGVLIIGVLYCVVYMTILIMQITHSVFSCWTNFVIDIVLLAIFVVLIDGLVKILEKKSKDES
jgi:hypothetical protein